MGVQTWNLAAPPEFQGFREDLPVTMYLRHLPHWRQPGATYFVTFCLADSLPQVKLDELASIRREWVRRLGGNEANATKEELENLTRSLMEKHERWLDEGHGACYLEQLELARLVANSMHHFDGERYLLHAYVVMPNHVHVLLRPRSGFELEGILGSWKQFSAREINRRVDRQDNLWQDECYDRIVRDEEHLYRCLQYIGGNLAKIGRKRQGSCCWVCPTWEGLGWGFEAEDLT